MAIRMAHFPEHPAVPIRFQDHAAFERNTTEEAFLQSPSVIEQRTALGETAGSAGWVGHIPAVDDPALKVDEIDRSVFHKMRSKQSKPWETRSGRTRRGQSAAARERAAQSTAVSMSMLTLFRAGP
jgi:hypothetical protein